MGNLLTPLDVTIFFASLIAVMGLGLWAGRKEDTSADYYLAGKSTRWWGVAGSIFGSNVSANHVVGMMGVGFSVGFAQSHFEIGAIAGLLLLCYGFLPMYRKLNLYTLSEYLGRRYNDGSRVAYALIMLTIMVIIGMVPGFYIGSRSLNILRNDGRTATARAIVNNLGEVTDIEILRPGTGYDAVPRVEITPSFEDNTEGVAAAMAAVADGAVSEIAVTSGGSGYDAGDPPSVKITGGARFDADLCPGDVDPKWFILGIVLMALVTGTYTIFGGLKAVIVTDVIQTVLVLAAGLTVAVFTFAQPEIAGWGGMMALDATGAGKLHLYEPISHPKLPWTGVLTGLMVLHFYYWGANQFIVQRALSARTAADGRMGIIVAGFLKLLIPFFSVGTGIAAFYLFNQRQVSVDQDVVFIALLTELVAPIGRGLLGLISAGVIGAILSSIDSMMNSSATIITFDIYRRFINPDASERQLVWFGRMCIAVILVGSALLTIFTMDPNSTESFFLHIAKHQTKLIAGVIVAFAMGMLWRRATAAAGIVTIVAGVVLSYGLPPLYAATLGRNDQIAGIFGRQINFFHAVAVAAVLCVVLNVVVSLLSRPDEEKSKLTWVGLGLLKPATIGIFALAVGVTFVVYAILGIVMVCELLPAAVAAWSAAAWTLIMFLVPAVKSVRAEGKNPAAIVPLLSNDRFWAGVLAGSAVFLMFYFR